MTTLISFTPLYVISPILIDPKEIDRVDKLTMYSGFNCASLRMKNGDRYDVWGSVEVIEKRIKEHLEATK